jgi:hypothetical protein
VFLFHGACTDKTVPAQTISNLIEKAFGIEVSRVETQYRKDGKKLFVVANGIESIGNIDEIEKWLTRYLKSQTGEEMTVKLVSGANGGGFHIFTFALICLLVMLVLFWVNRVRNYHLRRLAPMKEVWVCCATVAKNFPLILVGGKTIDEV